MTGAAATRPGDAEDHEPVVGPAATTLAVGGNREIPVPDPVARDYLLLALRLDQHISGLVDGYFGPADLKAQVDMEQLRKPERLRDDARALRARIAAEVSDPGRRAWLAAQVDALEAQAAALAGQGATYLDHVARCFDWRPTAIPDAELERAAAEIDAILPGEAPLDARLAAWDDQVVLPVERLPGVLDWLTGVYRARAQAAFGLPAGEALRVSLVTSRPWSGYNWYDGGLRSRVEVNTDLPLRAPDLLFTMAHETYPGHHLEHAWKEAELVMRAGRLESSVLLINTPECLLSEGLADLGFRFAVPPGTEADLLVELFERAGLPIAADPSAAREIAAQATALRPARHRLRAVAGNAALLRHVDGREREAVIDYLVAVGRQQPERAEHGLSFIDHPLWRTYVFVYHEGEALLARWLEQVPSSDQPARFGRLLREALTPSMLAAELSPDES